MILTTLTGVKTESEYTWNLANNPSLEDCAQVQWVKAEAGRQLVTVGPQKLPYYARAIWTIWK